MSRVVGLFAWAMAISLGASAWGQEPADELQLPQSPVQSVELRAERGWSPPRGLMELISVAVGAPLDRGDVRDSVRSLRAALEASEVETHLLRGQEGVQVVFALWPTVRVADVKLEGESCVDRDDLAALLDQHKGAPLSESQLVRGLYKLQDFYRESGFLEARVRLAVDSTSDGSAVVRYVLECGRVARIANVTFPGELGDFEESELMGVLRGDPGKKFSERTASRDAESLEEFLIGKGYRLARATEPRSTYREAESEVDLEFPVEVGPRFEILVLGVDSEELRRAGVHPLQAADRFDEALLQRDVRELRRHFQERGHYRVAVETEQERSDELWRILVRVAPGPVYALNEVAWDGLVSQSLDTLAATRSRQRAGRAGSRLVDSVLERDLSRVRSALALNGFDEAQVGPAVVEEVGTDLRVRVPVIEGRRRQVVHIEFLGARSLAETELREIIALTEGGPFHPLLLEESLNAIRAAYEERGYARIQASADLEWNDDQTLADLEIRLLEGPRTVVEHVVLRGNIRTAPGPILKAAGIDSGDSVSRSDLLQVQRRLYSLGTFSSVEVTLSPGEPLTGHRDVILRVREGRRRKASFGIGWDSEDGVRALLGLSHRNLFQRAISGRIDLRWSEREQQARLLVQQPFLGRLELPTTYSLFAIEEMQDSFTSKRRGFQVETSKLGRGYQFNLLYTYKLVEVEPDAAFEALRPAELARVLDIDRDLREVRLASLRPVLWVDRRNDPVRPTSGWSSTLSTEYAFPFLATDAEFLKSFSQQTAYLSLGRMGGLAGSFRLGAIEPLGGSTAMEGAPELRSRRVPISERFFAGGRTTHRAYRRDRLGVLGESLIRSDGDLVAVGGNGLLLANLDYRFPIAGPVGGVAFVDAGNIWADWRDISPRDAKVGAGLGVRYDSPIGPLRVEVGWKLDRIEGESPAVVFLSFGNPF